MNKNAVISIIVFSALLALVFSLGKLLAEREYHQALLTQAYTELPSQQVEIAIHHTSDFDSTITVVDTNNLPFNLKALGTFLVTAYCPCQQCCGDYALNRPIVNNRPIVYTASYAIAHEGVTIATDPSLIPHDTTVYIEGIGFRIAQDTGSAVKGKMIDIYYENHDEAKAHGVQELRVYTLTP